MKRILFSLKAGFIFLLVISFLPGHITDAFGLQVPGLRRGHENRFVKICGQPRPECVNPLAFKLRCQYEQVYESLINDPPIWDIQVRLRTGRERNADTDDDVYVQFTNDSRHRVFLDRIQNDFEKGADDWYYVVGGGVTKLSDIKRLQVGMKGTDGWCFEHVDVQINNGPLLFSSAPPGGGCKWLDDNGSTLFIPRHGFSLSSRDKHRAIRLPNIIQLRKNIEASIGHSFSKIPNLGWNGYLPEREALTVRSDGNSAHVLAQLVYKGNVDLPAYYGGGSERVEAHLQLTFDVTLDNSKTIKITNPHLVHSYVTVSGFRGAIASLLGIDERQIKQQIKKIDLGKAFNKLSVPLGVSAVQPNSVSFSGDVIMLSWPDLVSKPVAMVNTEMVPGPVNCGPTRDESPSFVGIKSVQSGKFVRAGVGKGSRLAATSNQIRGWEKFKLIQLGGDRIALKSVQSGKYVRAGIGQGSFLAATSNQIGGWEKFKLIRLNNNKIALQSVQNGKYVRAGVGKYSYLAAVSPHIREWETFRLVE